MMSSAKFYVWTNRWREVDVCRGVVSGWRRRARFVFMRRGKLHLAATAPVLRALRALAAGQNSAVRNGPRLALRNITKQKSRDERVHEVRSKHTDVGVQCMSAVDVSTQAGTLCLNVQARGHGTTHNEYDISMWNDNKQVDTYTNNETFDTKKQDTPKELSAKIVSKESKPPPKIKTRIVSSDTNSVQKLGINYNSEDDFVEKIVRNRAPALGPLLDAAAPKAKPWRVNSSTSPEPVSHKPGLCKELVISEGDVLVLRGLVARTRPAALARFDADESYRRALFYAINPLVELRRCKQLERALRDRHYQMTDMFAARLGLTRRDTTQSPVDTPTNKRTRRHRPQHKECVSTEIEEQSTHSDDRSSTRNVKSPTLNTKRDNTPIPKTVKTQAKRASRRKSSSDTDKENFVLRNTRRTTQTTTTRTTRRRHSPPTRDTRSSDSSDDNSLQTLQNIKSVETSQRNMKHNNNIGSLKNREEVEKSQTSKELNSDKNKRGMKLLDNNKRVEMPENNSDQVELKQKKKKPEKVQKKNVSEKKSTENSKKEEIQPHNDHTHVISKRASSSRCREYSNLEDHAIVAWVSTGSRAARVNGNQVWRELQQQYERLTGHSRSWHSLRNRYLRYILPALRALHLPPSTEARLRAAAATGSIRRGAKTSRRNSIFHQSTVRSASASAATKHNTENADESSSSSSPSPARSKPTVAKLTVTAVPTIGRQSPVRRSPRYSEITRRYNEAHSSDTSNRDSSTARTVRTNRSTARTVRTDSPAGRTRTRRLFNPNAVI